VIIDCLRSKEERVGVEKEYLKAQSEVDEESRARIVDWMVGVQMQLRFSDETLLQSIHLFDRFLSLQPIEHKHLPLLGLVTILIAGKCEEVCPPRLKKLLSLSEGSFTSSEALDMELNVMKCLDFDIMMPTVLQYLLKLCQTCLHRYNLALYICESQILYSEMSHYSPSLVAVSGFYLASKAVKAKLEIADLPLKELNHTEQEIKECSDKMIANMISKDRLELSNVGRKYARFRNVIIVAFNN
jgi:hypothetical protein